MTCSVRLQKGVRALAVFLVLTVLGEDRPGLVESLSQAIAAHGGNWLESRMSRLAGKFAGILRASVPESEQEALTATLRQLELQGLRLLIEWSANDEPAQAYQILKLDLIGNDRMGIIHDISQSLAMHGVNIDELNTDYLSAPMSGEMLFKATARIRVPLEVAVADLQTRLEHIAHDLMVDITLEIVSATASV
jgi:glycine cleavage system regulatory protein